MAKRVVKKISRSKSKKSDFENRVEAFDDAVAHIEDSIDEDVEVVEKWVIERRKFFIKLGLVIVLTILLILIAYIIGL